MMMAIGLAPLGLWTAFVIAMGGVPMDLTWMGILATSGLLAYGIAVFVAGIGALQAVRGRHKAPITWILIAITAVAVVGPWLYWALRRGG